MLWLIRCKNLKKKINHNEEIYFCQITDSVVFAAELQADDFNSHVHFTSEKSRKNGKPSNKILIFLDLLREVLVDELLIINNPPRASSTVSFFHHKVKARLLLRVTLEITSRIMGLKMPNFVREWNVDVQNRNFAQSWEKFNYNVSLIMKWQTPCWWFFFFFT